MANFSLFLLFIVSLYLLNSVAVNCKHLANITLGYCGLAEYDVNQKTLERHGLNLNNAADVIKFQLEKVPPMFRIFMPTNLSIPINETNEYAQQVPPNQPIKPPPINPQRAAHIASHPIPIMYRVIYDSSMEAEFPDKVEREDFIRDLVFGAQLIYEQKEFYPQVKLHLVVTSIEKLRTDFPIDYTASEMLTQINNINSQTRNNSYWDITIMLFRRNIFRAGDERTGDRLLGIATSASFCSHDPDRPPLLVINAFSANTAYTLAHELAHTLDIMHDGFSGPGRIESQCPNNEFIMTSRAGPGRLLWSQCSVYAALMYLGSDLIFNCAYNPKRVANAKAINEKFAFQIGSSRRPYPGEKHSLDRQCEVAVDKVSKEAVDSNDSPRSLGACKALFCKADHSQTCVGPALFGSNCTIWGSNQTGHCINTMCSQEPLV